jgi:hypothetical protein
MHNGHPRGGIIVHMRFGRKVRLPSTVEIKHQLLVRWLNDQQAREAAAADATGLDPDHALDRAATYRKRAGALDKAIARRNRNDSLRLRTKQTALRDMADNEDWLNGKPGSSLKPA